MQIRVCLRAAFVVEDCGVEKEGTFSLLFSLSLSLGCDDEDEG